MRGRRSSGGVSTLYLRPNPWGRGTLKVAALASAAGLPAPEIEDGGGCVTVRFRPAQAAPRPGDRRNPPERQETILALLDRADDGLTLRDILARMTPPASERQDAKGAGKD